MRKIVRRRVLIGLLGLGSAACATVDTQGGAESLGTSASALASNAIGGGGNFAGGGGQWGGGGGFFAGGGGSFAGGGGFFAGGGGAWSGGGGSWGGGGGQWSGGGGYWGGGGGGWGGGGGSWSGGSTWWNAGGGSFAGGGANFAGGGANFAGGGGFFAGGGGLWGGGFASAYPFLGWSGARAWQFRGVPQPASMNGGVQYQAAVVSTWPTFSGAGDTSACAAGQVRLGGFNANIDVDGWPGFLALGYSKALCIPTPGNGGLRVQATAGDGSMIGAGGYVMNGDAPTASTSNAQRDAYMLTSLVGSGTANIATQYGGALCASIGTLAAAKRSCAVGIAHSDLNTARDGATLTARGVTVKSGAQAGVASENTPFGRPDGHGLYGEAPGDMESYANHVMQEHTSVALPTAASAVDAWNGANLGSTLPLTGSDFTPRGLSASPNAADLLANINRSLTAPLNMVPVDPVVAGTTVQDERIANMANSLEAQSGKLYALNLHSLAEQQNPLYGSGGGRWFFHDPTDPSAASKPLLDLSAVYQGSLRLLTGQLALDTGTLSSPHISDSTLVYADWRPNPSGTLYVDHAGQYPTAIASDMDRNARLRTALAMPPQALNLAEGGDGSGSNGSHTCVVTVAGGVECWGSNLQGQLGVPVESMSSSATPVQVEGLQSGVKSVSAGALHTCALLEGGTVKCWGENLYGQLGDSRLNRSSTPLEVSGLSGVTALRAGIDSTCALLANGTVRCWGKDNWGQLGNGSLYNQWYSGTGSVEVTGLPAPARAISTGQSHACAVLTDGQVYCWGRYFNGQFPKAAAGVSNAVDVRAFDASACALLANGRVMCWGSNTNGQLGNGDTSGQTPPSPTLVAGLTDVVSLGQGNSLHTCAIRSNGTTWCWGYNQHGQLGDGTTTTAFSPVLSSFPSATAIAQGRWSTCVRTTGGDVQCVGQNLGLTPVSYGLAANVFNGGLLESQASVLVQKFTAAAGSTVSGHVTPIVYSMANGTTGTQALMVTYDPLAAAAAMFIDQYQAHVDACNRTTSESITEQDQQAGTYLWACSNPMAKSGYLAGMAEFLLGAKTYLFGRPEGSLQYSCNGKTAGTCLDTATAHFPYTFVVPNYTETAFNPEYYAALDTALATYRSGLFGSNASTLHKALQLAGIAKFDTNTSAIVTTRVKRSGAFGASCITDGSVPPPPSCVPTTCAALGANCGTVSDGCGGTLSCGTCSDGQTCGAGGTNVCGGGNPVLTLSVSGRSGVAITSTPAGLSVTSGVTDTASFPSGTTVQLSVGKGKTANFSGACVATGKSVCTFTITNSASVSAAIQ